MSPTSTHIIASQNANKLLTTKEAADYIGVLPGTLGIWRCTKRHMIPFIKVGRLVKYRKSDLDTFLDQRTIREENI